MIVATAELPIRLVSTANTREHWATKAARAKQHRHTAYWGLRNLTLPPDPPYLITITRYGPRKLDDDNLAISAKSLRDGIADLLGIDDGGERLKWVYAQATRKTYAVGIRIEAMA